MFQHAPTFGLALLASKFDTTNTGSYSTTTNQTLNPGETVIFFISNRSANTPTSISIGGTNIIPTARSIAATATGDGLSAHLIYTQRFTATVASGTTVSVTITEGTASALTCWRIYGTSTLQNYSSAAGQLSLYNAASNIGTTSPTVVDGGYRKNVLSLVLTTVSSSTSGISLTGVTAGYGGFNNYLGAVNQYLVYKFENYWNPGLTESIAQQQSGLGWVVTTWMRFVT
jgi:hypothetical protein